MMDRFFLINTVLYHVDVQWFLSLGQKGEKGDAKLQYGSKERYAETCWRSRWCFAFCKVGRAEIFRERMCKAETQCLF